MHLRPSEIYYSQDSICSSFNTCRGIGLLVDDVCNGSVSISDIDIISVAKVNGKWFTCDNRRLWVFKELEGRGRCHTIQVNEIHSIPESKMTTENGGVSVKVRGDPRVSRAPRYHDSDDSDDFEHYGDGSCSDENDDW